MHDAQNLVIFTYFTANCSIVTKQNLESACVHQPSEQPKMHLNQ